MTMQYKQLECIITKDIDALRKQSTNIGSHYQRSRNWSYQSAIVYTGAQRRALLTVELVSI